MNSSPRALQQTGTFRALSSRRKMLTQKHYALPFTLGDEVFGRFTTRDLLGQGPMGFVYQVVDKEGALWALKVIHKRWREGLDLERFTAELTQIQANGEQLCLASEVLSNETHVALCLPLLSGLTLRKLISLRKSAQKSFQLDEVSQLLSGIHGALAPLHQQGIAHGALKPENIFVSAADDGRSESQQVTLSDAKLPTALGLEAYARAQSASGHGHSIAPEIIEGVLTPASDVYCVGAILYEAFTQQSLQGGKRLVSEVLGIHGIDPLDQFINKALDDDPAKRMQDIDELLNAFAEASVQLRAIEGSPFSSEGTDPSGESPENAQLTSGTNAIPMSDPLLGGTPPLPAQMTSSDELVAMKLGAQPSPPAIPLPNIGGPQPPTLPPRAQVETDEISSSADSAELLIDISPKDESPAVIGSGAHHAVNPSMQPLVLNPSARGPWLLNSTFGFALSALLVVGGVASGVFFFLSGEGQQGQKGAVKVTPVSALNKSAPQVRALTTPESDMKTAGLVLSEEQARAKAEEQARAKAEEQARAEAEEQARVEAEEQARAEAEEQARAEAEEQARAEAEEQARAEAKKKAQAEAKTQASRDAVAQKRAEREVRAAQKRAEREARAAQKRAEREEREAQKRAEREERAAQKRAEREERAAQKRAEREEREAKAKAAQQAKAQAKRSTEALKMNTADMQSSTKVPSKANVTETKGSLSCPNGMLARTTKTFPKGSVRGGMIKGAAAVAMAKEGHAYCIDAYEYPGRGQVPKVNVNFAGAQALCSQINKRLCTDTEWRKACGSTFPYGRSFNGSKCNTEDAEGEERKIAASGSFKRCRYAGVYDMSGNVSEWTADKTVRGGYYASADEDAACNGGGRRSPSSKRNYIGFRCCADFK